MKPDCRAKIIDGKSISEQVRREITVQVLQLAEDGITPGLAVVVVGDDPASRVYVNNKKKACEQVGIYSEEYSLAEQTTEAELLELIDRLNAKPDIDGILVQLPLPKHINEQKITQHIIPSKDVDAFHATNVGKVMLGNYKFLPCTPAGVMELLKQSDVEIAGKHCVVVGRSNIVGKPMAMLLMAAHGTVTICHSKTKDLAEICKSADILVVAIGKAKFLTADMVKPGVVVIDVGMNRDDNGKLCGDVDFDSVAQLAGAITPVPGGVGPMTITMLLQNTVQAVK